MHMAQSDTPKHSYRLKHLLVMLMDAARQTHTEKKPTKTCHCVELSPAGTQTEAVQPYM